jgi:hypothetical protein
MINDTLRDELLTVGTALGNPVSGCLIFSMLLIISFLELGRIRRMETRKKDLGRD